MTSFIKVTEDKCACCDDTVLVYHIPLPTTAVTFNPVENFTLHLDEEELRTLYLEIKEHLTGLHDVQPIS